MSARMFTRIGLLFLFIIASTAAVCPVGSHYNGDFNKCYEYFSNATTFLSAELSCRSLGGNLLAIQNAYENTYVAALVYPYAYDFWIGANLLMDTQWMWTNGYYLNYFNFAAGQSSDPSLYECAAYGTANNAWTKNFCSSRKSYMCQFDPSVPAPGSCSTPATTTPSTPSTCPTGYCDSPDYLLNPAACKCYKLYWAKSTYSDSLTYCQAENANLTIVRNAAENKWLTTYIQSQASREASPLLGIQCSSSSASNCRWIDGTLPSYNNFELCMTRFNERSIIASLFNFTQNVP